MKQIFKIYVCLLGILMLTNCASESSNFYDCFVQHHGELVEELLNDFDHQLMEVYKRDKYEVNLLQYLSQFEENKTVNYIKPNSELVRKLENSNLIEDIWESKSVRNNSSLIKCLKQSENQLTLEYLDRLVYEGDMAPTVLAKGASDLLKNEKIDKELQLIFMINFYLIWLN